MCNKCNGSCNSCNCTCNSPCTTPDCACKVFLSTDCITLSEDLACSNIVKGQTETEVLKQLDAYICDRFNSIDNSFQLISVGDGSEVYKGISVLGKKEIRSITSEDESIIITQNTNTIDLSIPAGNQDNFVRQIRIDRNLLPEAYSNFDVLDYFLTLPEEDRTLTETDSKLNVIVGEEGEGYYIAQIFEIQNKGKGVIEELEIDDFLQLRNADAERPSWQNVLVNGTELSTSHECILSGELFNLSSYDNDGSSGGYFGVAQTSLVDYPDAFIGRRIGNNDLAKSALEFNSTSTVFTDNVSNKGIVYNGAYEANFTGKSIVTKDYVLSVIPPAPDGSETKVTAGTNISITGVGTTLSPYVVNSTLTIDGSETKINNGITTTKSGTGTTGSPYVIEVNNLQKVITYPTDFTGTNYTLTNADKDYTIFIDNGATPVTITLNTAITTANYCVGFIQEGSSDVTFVGTGVTLTNPIGLKSKGLGYQTFIERKLATSSFYLLGNTKA